MKGTSQQDKDLAARFAREVEPLFNVLSRGARRLTRSDADAEDLLQDTLLHAYAGFGGFHQGSNLRAWLFRILYNRWVSAYRANSAAHPKSLSTGSPSVTWRTAPCGCRRRRALPRRRRCTRCPTSTSNQRWTPCRKASG